VEAERERERERGALGTVWSSATAWQWRAHAACCRVTMESGGVGATWVDVADRWAKARWGPDRQQLGAAWGSAVRRSAQR
jgi:hypothetical protein